MRPDITLHVEPGIVKNWDEFRQQSPPFSMALDGYVDAPPSFDAAGPHANFDHHFGVNRLATRSTSGQVLVAVSLGLFDTFQRDGRGIANVYVNDCDHDVSLAYWLLCNADLVSGFRIEMDIVKLIIGEDFLDTTAGAYPVDIHRPAVRKLVWVFEAYSDARATGRLSQMGAGEMQAVIEETARRITCLTRGDAEERDAVGDYNQIGGSAKWKMIREEGAFARTKLFSEGTRAFVSVRDRPDGRIDFSIGRMSPFVDFPLDRIFRQLNAAEGTADSSDRWGGSDTIGGSPRRAGSRLSPAEVERLIESVIRSG